MNSLINKSREPDLIVDLHTELLNVVNRHFSGYDAEIETCIGENGDPRIAIRLVKHFDFNSALPKSTAGSKRK